MAIDRINTAALTPIIAFGQAWLPASQLREALGFGDAEHFRLTVRDAQIYARNVRRVQVNEAKGEAETCYTLDGADQLALFVASRSGHRKPLARQVQRQLHALRFPSFGEAA